MTRYRSMFVILTLALLGGTPRGDYTLVWSDEFDRDGKPDPANWTYEQGFVRNEELQWYQPENARCEGGLLIIEGRRERVRNPKHKPGSRNWRRNREHAEFTSASLKTAGRRQWQYGRFEIRARIDPREGLWPAIWTLGVAGEWPSNGEVDIMESYSGKILANVAWASEKRWVPRWDSVKKPLKEFTDGDPEWAGKFHTWRMDWDDSSIKVYLDGVLMNETDLGETLNPDGRNPFRQPHYLLLNLAITGGSEFPSLYEVDYVRVYQKR